MKSTNQKEATLQEAIQLGLTETEFETITNILGKKPNYSEAYIYSIIWKNNNSLQNTIKGLKELPKVNKKGGIINLGDNKDYILKTEVHNPNQKTSHTNSKEGQTIAQMHSLYFGNIEKVETKQSLKETTKAISDSDNTSKIQTMGVNLTFNESAHDSSNVTTFSIRSLDSKSKKSKASNNTYLLDIFSEKDMKGICENLEVEPEEVNFTTDIKSLYLFKGEELLLELSIDSLIKSETGDKEISTPAYFQQSKNFKIDDVKEPDDLKEVATFLLKHQDIASRRWVNNQFNALKRTGANVTKSPSDARIIELKDTNHALAMTIGGNSRYINADPYIGSSIAIAEAARNIVCSGGEPTAVSTHLNFDVLNNDGAQWQYENTTRGISAVCKKIKTPVTGGVISTSSATTNGMIGLVEDKNKAMSFDFKHKGDLIFILGEAIECIASSTYLNSYHGIKESPAPHFNINKEFEMQEVVKTLIKKDLVNAAHGCSAGGIFIALTEMAMPNELGFDIVTDAEIREDAFLFGEAAGRVLVAVNEKSEDAFITFMIDAGVNFTLLGHVTQGKLVVDDEHYGFVQAAKKSYNSALETLIE